MATINITIRNTLNDQQYKLKVPKNISAGTLLTQLSSKVRIPDNYVLVFGDRVIGENTPMKDAGVDEGDSLKLMPNPLGGKSETLTLLQLPEDLWKRRLEFEYNTLRDISEKEPIDFKANKDYTEYEIIFNGTGLINDSEGNINKNFKNIVKVSLNRSFPYAGGMNIKWIEPENIFHPNIDPPMICIDMINKWKPMQDLAGVIDGLRWMLQHPNPDDPYKSKEEVAAWYKENWENIKEDEIILMDEETKEDKIELEIEE